MKKSINRLVLMVALSVGSLVGFLKGAEAKQKWVFRIRSRFEEKRQMAENKRLLKDGGVPLDDIELASFHRM